MPEERSPIIRPRVERLFVEQGVVAGRDRVVSNYLNALLRQPRVLVQVAERIQVSRGPGIAAATGMLRNKSVRCRINELPTNA